MDDNELLMIVLAFVVGYMASGMMKSMCGGRLVEGNKKNLNSKIKSCGLDLDELEMAGVSENSTELLIGQNAQNIDNIFSFLNCLKG